MTAQQADVASPEAVQYPEPDQAVMLQALRALIEPGAVVELRAFHKGKKRVVSGYFDSDHWSQLAGHADRLNRQGAAVYVTLNPVDSQLLARYHNRLQDYADKTTSDRDIVRRRWLLVDLDPARPADTSATNSQSQAAFERAMKVFNAMIVRGWPRAQVADSGNGYHLLWEVDLPNDDASTSLVKGALAGLAALFDGEGIKVDQSVFNAARICKLWGTVATKGDHSSIAPHRLSKLEHTPPRVPVTIEQLQAVAALAPAKVSSTPQRASFSAGAHLNAVAFSLEGFLTRHGLDHTTDQHNGSDRFKLARCPFNAEHVNGEAAVLRDGDGKLGFRCMHDSCSDRTWKAVRERFDGPRPARQVADAEGMDVAACASASRRRNAASGPASALAGADGEGGPNNLPDDRGAPLNQVEAEDDGASGLSHAPVFDYKMCPGALGRFIESETEFSEAPPIGVLANVVTRLSADIGRTCFISLGHKKLHLRVNWLCAGPTGVGRKGTAAEIADVVRRAAFAAQESSLLEPASMQPARVLTSLSTGEGLISQVRTSKRKDDAPDFQPPGLTDNRLLADCQEFSSVLKKASGKEATLSATLREAFDGNTLSNASITNAMAADQPHIVISASVPGGELVKLLSGDAAVEVSNGLLNRFAITYQVRNKILSHPLRGAQHVFDQFADAYRLALNTAWAAHCRYTVSAESTVDLSISDEAMDCYDAWYVASQNDAVAPQVAALMARAPIFLRVYSAILALLRGSLCTEVGDIEAAKLLVKYWSASLEFLFSQGRQTAEAQQMQADARRLLDRLSIGVSVQMAELKDIGTAAQRRATLDWAQRQSPPMVALRRAQNPGGGRPTELVTRLV